MNSCPTCGGADHRRFSSSRCPLRKKRARESVDDGSYDTYSVKRGLRGFVCPLLESQRRERLLSEIRRDVKDLSSFSVDFSILVHYFYTALMVRLDDDAEFLRLHPRFDGRALAAVFSEDGPNKTRRLAKLNDPDGLLETWSSLCPRRYGTKHRSFLISHVVNGYATALETNVNTHAFARIKRAIAAETGAGKKEIHDACYARFYTSAARSGLGPVDDWFDSRVPGSPTPDALKKDYWRFVPMFRRMQASAWAAATAKSDSRGGRGFRLFPQCRHGLKHLLYDGSALMELLRRADRDATPSTWKEFNATTDGEAGSRRYWRRYFDCPTNFGYSLRTDGVAISIVLMRKQKGDAETVEMKKKKRVKTATKTAKMIHDPVPTTSYHPHDCVAVDPGAREPVVTCSENGRGELVFARLTAGRVYYETGELWRERRRRKITGDVDERVRAHERSVKTEDCSSKHAGDPSAYTRFRLAHFDELQRAYENRKLARLRFEKYSRRQKFMSKIVREFFPDARKTVLYGAGCKFMNRVSFRHRKFSHDSLLRELKRSGRTVALVDESWTTKRCYRCFGGSIVKIGPSPHRYVHCPVCSGANRDRNGAANILLKSTGRWKITKSQSPLPTTARESVDAALALGPP